MAITTVKGLFSNIEYSLTGGNSGWRKIPGISEYTESGGERPSTTVTTFDGAATIAGLAQTATITANSQALPHHRSWVDLRNAYVNGTPVHIRITTREEENFVAATNGGFGITTAGVFTATGTNTPDFTGETAFAAGMVVKAGNARYNIDSISDAGAVLIDPAPTTAVSVAPGDGYSIVTPSLRRQFQADVTITDRLAITAEGTATNSFTLSAKSQLPAFTIV